MEAGTEERSFVAMARASWVMLAPSFWGWFVAGARPVLLGWTENTNSMVARTPSSLRGRRVRVSTKGPRSHSGSTLGLIKALRAGRRAHVSVLWELGHLQDSEIAATYLFTIASYSIRPFSRVGLSFDGLKALLPASTMFSRSLDLDCWDAAASAMTGGCSLLDLEVTTD